MAITVTVKPGDTVLSLAKEHGFVNWKFVWEQNEELRKKRTDPNVLLPGDQLLIPDKRLKDLSRATNEVYKFRVKEPFALIDIVLRNEHGYRLRNMKFQADVGEKKLEGRSDGEGRLCIAVPADTKNLKLTIWPDPNDEDFAFEWDVAVGKLDPIVDPSGSSTGDVKGAIARLNNLGFEAGPPSTTPGKEFTEAVKAFQKYVGVEEPSGEFTDETRRLLEALHNSI